MGGSSKKNPKIAADNLYSQDMVELVAAIGEGTIYGLKDGLESFNVGQVPFQSETGDLNFQDLCVSFRQGYFDDLPIKYVMGGEASIMNGSVSTSLPGEVARTFITPATHRGRIKQIDVRLLVSLLYAGDSKGNSSTSSLLLSVKYRKVGATDWIVVNETTASLYRNKALLETLRQEAFRRGLIFDSMSEADKKSFAEEVLTDSQIISSADQLTNNYIPSYTGSGYGLSGLQGMSVQHVAAQKYAQAVKEQLSQNEEIQDAYNAGALRIEGKTTAGYLYELTIPIFDKEGDTHDWEIQIMRLSKELTSEEKKFSNKEITLESLALITDNEKTYRKTALCHIVAQHTDRFDNIPDFSGEFYGLICEVPSNYNPFEHTYDETNPWDGTYKKGWTNNPFWILRELIMNQDWGLRSVERRVQIDNANFYKLAKYCDEKVPTLKPGEVAPRYTFNEVVQQKQKIKDYINYVAGAAHTTLREINGVYFGFMDKPNKPYFFVTPEMILQPNFQYSSADLESKYNQVSVTFLNSENNYDQDRRTIVDNDSINKYGVIPYEFQAVGCTNVSEAIRQGVYNLLTNRDEDIFTTFQCPRLGHLVNIYDYFYIAHKENGWGNHARIKFFDSTSNKIHLRDQIFKAQNYIVMFHTPFGIAEVGVYSEDEYTLRLTESNDSIEYLVTNTPVVIKGGVYGQPKVFRVLGMVQDDTTGASGGEVFEFKAAIVSDKKFEAADNINNPELVNLQYNIEDVIYKREPAPSPVENVRLRYKDWASYNGQLVYQLNFTANVEAYYYDVIWQDDSTGEQRNKRLFSLGGELFPAFDRETKKISLFITPYNRKGEAGETKYIRDIVPYNEADSKLPILQGITSEGGNIKVSWSAETSDMFDYKFKYFSYSTPVENVNNIKLTPDVIQFLVPNHGKGKYLFQLVYDRDGSGVRASSEVWNYTSNIEANYNQPQLTKIITSNKNSSGQVLPPEPIVPPNAEPVGKGYVQINVTQPDWETNVDLNSLTNPFGVRFETSVGSNNFEFIQNSFYVVRESKTTARIIVTNPRIVGTKIQVRAQNQWGTTFSSWSEITVPPLGSENINYNPN